MKISKREFGIWQDKQIDLITLENVNGTKVVICNYGALIQGIEFNKLDVVLGYDNLAQYTEIPAYFHGVTVGRFANRIADGKYTINNQEYVLDCNEGGRGHLHGGYQGFDKRVFDYQLLSDGVVMRLISKHLDQGYNGNLLFAVTFKLDECDALHIEYQACCDEDSYVNFTNHAYFNLNGIENENILNHQLKINAETFLPVDEKMIPFGNYQPVAGTAFDFTEFKTIAKDINTDDIQIERAVGYDHNYVIQNGREFLLHAMAKSASTNIQLEVYSDMPGIQFYSGYFIKAEKGKGKSNHDKFQGFCLETQFFPDSPNQPNFPSCMIKQFLPFYSKTTYKFVKIGD